MSSRGVDMMGAVMGRSALLELSHRCVRCCTEGSHASGLNHKELHCSLIHSS